MSLCDATQGTEAPVPSAPPAPQPAVGKKEYKDETVEGQTVDGAVIVDCEVKDCTLWNCKMKTVQFMGVNTLHNCVVEDGNIGGQCTVRGGSVNNCEFAAGGVCDLIDCKTSMTRVSGTVKLSGGSFTIADVMPTGRLEEDAANSRRCAVSHVHHTPATGRSYKGEGILEQAIVGAEIENCEILNSTLWDCKIKIVELKGVNALHDCAVSDATIGGQCIVRGGSVNNCEFAAGGVYDLIDCKTSMTRVSGTVKLSGGSFEWSEVEATGRVENETGARRCAVSHVEGSSAWVGDEPPAVGKKEYKNEGIVGQAIDGAKIENCEVWNSTLRNCKLDMVELKGTNVLQKCRVKNVNMGGQCTVLGGGVENCEFTAGGMCDLIDCKTSMTRVVGTVKLSGGTFEMAEVMPEGRLEVGTGSRECKLTFVDKPWQRSAFNTAYASY